MIPLITNDNTFDVNKDKKKKNTIQKELQNVFLFFFSDIIIILCDSLCPHGVTQNQCCLQGSKWKNP